MVRAIVLCSQPPYGLTKRPCGQAPMYYRGANAALLLYDITNASSFEDVRGWLEGKHYYLCPVRWRISRSLSDGCNNYRAQEELLSGSHYLYRRRKGRPAPVSPSHLGPCPPLTTYLVSTTTPANASTATCRAVHIFLHPSPLYFIYEHAIRARFDLPENRLPAP